jgi:hypothetical protein
MCGRSPEQSGSGEGQQWVVESRTLQWYPQGMIQKAPFCAALGLILGAAPAQAQREPAVGIAVANQPVLWGNLRTGMAPAVVHAALRAQGIKARLKVDGATRQAFVEVQDSVEYAGRKTEVALGFVKNALFYVDLGSHKSLPRAPKAGEDHFGRVLLELSKDYGAPLSLDISPAVTHRNQYGHGERREARFERSGLRADVTGNSAYTDAAALGRSVEEVVNIRFWTVAAAAAYLASERKVRPKPPTQ